MAEPKATEASERVPIHYFNGFTISFGNADFTLIFKLDDRETFALTTRASRRVRITTGDVAPGPNDDRQHDIVVMDDFIYGEPQALP